MSAAVSDLRQELTKQLEALRNLLCQVQEHIDWRVDKLDKLDKVTDDVDDVDLQRLYGCGNFFFFGESAIDLLDTKGLPAK